MATQIAAGSKPTQEQISQRAYEIYIERGRPEGRDLEHWLEAERQLSPRNDSSRSQTAAASAPEMTAPPRATRPGNGTARKASSRQSASRW